MKPMDIDGIANAVVANLSGGSGLLGCGSISSAQDYDPSIFACTGEYECGGAAVFACTEAFTCNNEFFCTLLFGCQCDFGCAASYNGGEPACTDAPGSYSCSQNFDC